VSWGLFRRDGSFLPVEGTPESETLARLFRHQVLRNLLAWPHTGFGAHVSRAIPADATTPRVVARCMTRPPITPERMLGEASKAQIIYRADAVHPRHQAYFRVFDPLDFLAEVSAHIPDPHAKTILLYGWYSNGTRGYRTQHVLLGKVRTVDPAPAGDARGLLAMRRSWARLIRKVREVDPPSCPRCRGTMKALAVIERPAILRQILDHLGLSTGTASLYLASYGGSDEALFLHDLHEKDEVPLVYAAGEIVGFTAVRVFEREWQAQRICVVYSGDTVVDREHWGHQALAFAWIGRMDALKRECPEIPLYWFLLVKGHRTLLIAVCSVPSTARFPGKFHGQALQRHTQKAVRTHTQLAKT
jgi:hypothetical protein